MKCGVLWGIALGINLSFNRRFFRKVGTLCFKRVYHQMEQEESRTQDELVSLLSDYLIAALEKNAKVGKGTMATLRPKKNTETYKAYLRFLEPLKKSKVNPEEFFNYCVNYYKGKKIPASMASFCSPKLLDCFVKIREKNKYRIQKMSEYSSHEERIFNQLDIDLTTLVSYMIRRTVATLRDPDLFMFSPYARVLLCRCGKLSSKKDPDEIEFMEFLQDNPEADRKVRDTWNNLLQAHSKKVSRLANQYTAPGTKAKIMQTVCLLERLILP